MKRTIDIILTMVMALTLMAAPVSAASSNLIVNGDFKNGNTDFYTDYTYLVTSFVTQWIWDAGTYTIQTDSHEAHGYWDSFGDHTSGTGNMMLVNGSTNSADVVWGQTVSLYTLYAAQTWASGEVLVDTASEGEVCVSFKLDQDVIDKGWMITEVHVDVQGEAEDFPQNKNNNPKVGQFAVSEAIEPATEAGPYCLDEPEEGDLLIAAHVKIERPEIMEGDVVIQPYGCESAWGEGAEFGGRNWATYMTYGAMYTLSFYARNTAPVEGSSDDCAQLQVKINGDIVGSTLVLSDLGEWQEFTATWDAGTASSATIEIFDLETAESPNDFAIDDISFSAN